MFIVRFFMNRDETGKLYTLEFENIRDVTRFIDTMEDTIEIIEVKGVK